MVQALYPSFDNQETNIDTSAPFYYPYMQPKLFLATEQSIGRVNFLDVPIPCLNVLINRSGIHSTKSIFRLIEGAKHPHKVQSYAIHKPDSMK